MPKEKETNQGQSLNRKERIRGEKKEGGDNESENNMIIKHGEL